MLAIRRRPLLIGACLIAWRNYLRQKTDLQSTLRLGAVIFSLEMVIWLFQAHFVPTVGSLGLFFLAGQLGSVLRRYHLHFISRPRALRAAALAARHHLLEPRHDWQVA